MNVGGLRVRVSYLIVLLVLAIACFMAGNLFTGRSSVQAQAPVPAEMAVPDAAGTCTITDVGVFNNRIHVNCQPGVGGIPTAIHYFAMPTLTPAESRLANRYLALLMAAKALGKTPYVAWLTSSSSNPGGCLVADCRQLDFVLLP